MDVLCTRAGHHHGRRQNLSEKTAHDANKFYKNYINKITFISHMLILF